MYNAGDAFVEQRCSAKSFLINATLTLDGAGNITAAVVDPDDNLPAGSVDFVLANGVGTLCPEYTFANLAINSTTLNILGIEIKDGLARKFHGALGVVTATSTANAAVGTTVFSRSKPAAAGVPGGAVSTAGHLVANLGIAGTAAGTGTSMKISFRVEWE